MTFIDAYGQEHGRVKEGGSYRFDYPAAFNTLPEYTARAGQIVTAVRQLTDDEAENDYGMWRIRCADGREGDAFPDELLET